MSEPFIGEIRMVGFTFAPRNWAFCDGQTIPIDQNTSLFELFGTTFGGDGRSTFCLPDLRGRVAIHSGKGHGLSGYTLGEKGGEEIVSLKPKHLASHNHGATGTTKAFSGTGDQSSPVDHVLAVPGAMGETPYSNSDPDTTMKSESLDITVENSGGGMPHNNMPPFLSIYFIVALQGIFPSRN